MATRESNRFAIYAGHPERQDSPSRSRLKRDENTRKGTGTPSLASILMLREAATSLPR